MTTVRYAATGVALGAGWGVVGRAWMRLIATEPAFSWAGTLSIIGSAAVAGLALGLVAAARARAGAVWWRLLYAVVLVLFIGPGTPLLPGVVVGGWGLRRGVMGRFVAAVALVSAPVILLALSWEEIDKWLNPYPDNVLRAFVGGGALVLCASAAWGSSVALGPWPRKAARPVPVDGPAAVSV